MLRKQSPQQHDNRHLYTLKRCDEQKNTAAEQLRIKLDHTKQATGEDKESETYAECYPSTYELGSFWEFRASDKAEQASKQHKPQTARQHQQHRDQKIARDLNKLEQWKRNAEERGDAAPSTPCKKPRY